MKDNLKDEDKEIPDLEGKTQVQLAEYVKNTASMQDLMAYNALFGMSILNFIMRDADARRFFLQKLDLI
jgi:hypothetical protein